jgi:hypothetical protein
MSYLSPDTPANYPLPGSDDHRLTWGLVHDVGKVFVAHGYPPLASDDLTRLMSRLFSFLYADTDEVDS